jgi:enamine deaminase RidA (YjgF/YER057c/UK114 family)
MYSHAVRVGELLFCSGITARTSDGSIFANDVESQLDYCFGRLRTLLEHVGSTPADIVKLTTYLVRFEDGPALSQVKRAFLGDLVPACTGLVVSSLSDPRLLIELDAICLVRNDESITA